MVAKTSSKNSSTTLASVELLKPLPDYRRADVVLSVVLLSVFFGVINQWGITLRLFTVLCLGWCASVVIIKLIGIWNPNIGAWYAYSKVENVVDATMVKVVPNSSVGNVVLCPLVPWQVMTNSDTNEIQLQKSFEFQKTRYVFTNSKENCGFSILSFPDSKPLNTYGAKGMSGFLRKDKRNLEYAQAHWGKNELDIPVPSFQSLFKEHIIQPFFVFQVFSCILWMLDEFWMMSAFTLGMLTVFECILVKQRIANLEMMRDMRSVPSLIYVLREKGWTKIYSSDVVPGDLISLRKPVSVSTKQRRGMKMDSMTDNNDEYICPCDALLLKGSLIVNEALLTGETVPLQKDSCSLLQREWGKNTVLDISAMAHRKAVIFGGTAVMQHNQDANLKSLEDTGDLNWLPKSPPDKGCIAFVLRTGWYTTQGGLMRKIFFSASRVTANSKEAFKFIGILLIFAIAAASYVLYVGLADERRDRWKLFLHTTMILTAVIPPELPMELSLAVTNALNNLRKCGVICTEPFRIPFAGKIDVCCFDKTGTLTSDHMVVIGIAGESTDGDIEPELSIAEDESKFIMATCHSLVQIDGKLEGDAMEKATLDSLGWSFSNHDIALSPVNKSKKSNNRQRLRVVRRFPFVSSLRCMSAIIEIEHERNNGKNVFWSVCKGAPEAILPMLKDKKISANYQQWYRRHALCGLRVLALAYKKLDENFSDAISHKISRNEAESELIFAGFLLFRCPTKKDSKKVIRQLLKSSHRVMMITGDSALTACSVASELKMSKAPKSKILILQKKKKLKEVECFGEESVEWMAMGEEFDLEKDLAQPFSFSGLDKLAEDGCFSFCVTGGALSSLFATSESNSMKTTTITKTYTSQLIQLSRIADIWARVSPTQKEQILNALKACGHFTLMCGDGTNDVGALKRADVGVAILNMPTKTDTDRASNTKSAFSDESQVVQFGDASIAAPFTSKSSSIKCTKLMIRFGRSTLVTTLQMYKIMALNCLVAAFMLSVLYIYGIKQGDQQGTIFGVVIAGFFLCISRSSPLSKLSKNRPATTIFNVNDLVSILGQFIIHIGLLYYSVLLALPFVDMDAEEMQPDADFKPNVINTVVFLVSSLQTLNNFVVNYEGHPFMKGLNDNKWLVRIVIFTYVCLFLAASNTFEPITDALECVLLPMGTCSNGSTAIYESSCIKYGTCNGEGQILESNCVRTALEVIVHIDEDALIDSDTASVMKSIPKIVGEWQKNEFMPSETSFPLQIIALMLLDTFLVFMWSRFSKML